MMAAHAIEYATHGWRVFPLRGKHPAIAGGRGLLDATTDLDQVTAWWNRYAGANIGIRLPEQVMVIDVDPRNGGTESLKALVDRYGPLPATLTAMSGRGDGGCHRYYRKPQGKVVSKLLGAGIDLKTSSGYVVAPPSIHPDTGKAYTWSDLAPIADPPEWLVDLIRPALRLPKAPDITDANDRAIFGGGTSPADAFTQSTTWHQVLEPHGWRCLDPDGDADGARWLHPAATSSCSATVRHDCLFVYSDNTVFDPTSAGDPNGLTRFRAHAVLNYGGDLSEAARDLLLTGAI